MCEYCQRAATQPDYPLYQAACRTCTVRAFAHGLPYWQSKETGAMVPAYVQALKAAFGEDWIGAHNEVKAESARITEARTA